MAGEIKKDIIIYYIFCFCLGFYIANGTTVLFELALNFSFQQVFIVAAFYMLMFILFEVPSGAFADLVGRKKSVVMGCLILTTGALASGFSNSFWQLFSSFFLWALGFSFISGASEALLYDRLRDEKVYTRVLGRSRFVSLSATALAGVVGPMLFAANFRYPYLFSAIPFFAGGLALLFFQEEHPRGSFTIREHFDQMKSGARFAFQNRFVLWAMGVLALTFAVWYNLSNSYQPFLQDIGFTIKAFSFILPAIFVCEALGHFFADKILRRFGENFVFAFGLLAFALSVVVAGFFGIKLSLIFLLIYSFLLGVLQTTTSTYANRHIDSSRRATVMSVQSMAATFCAALSLFLFGFLTDRIGIFNLFILLGSLAAVITISLLIFKPRETPGSLQ